MKKHYDRLIPKSPSFMIDEENKQFLLDGKPFQYISGSIHYFRIPRNYWEDRIKKVRSLGFNAIQYYIPWNMHEMKEGQFDFTNLLDFGEFSQIAHQNGLWTILRIGPYICGEWENGGLPAWLLNKNIKKQRSNDEIFIKFVKKWFDQLLPRIIPLLRKNGGPILMLQIENEYGSYGVCDKDYLRILRDYTRKHVGDDVLLFTTDGSSEELVSCGSIDGVLPTVDFGPTSNKTEVKKNLDIQRKFDSIAPFVNSEYYPGWLVLWGQKKQQLPSTQNIIDGAQNIYELGGNINFYMIHGGTNFGFWNGAETDAPCITSYDYSAPITEAGDTTENYMEIRKWIGGLENWPNPPLDVPANVPKKKYGKIKLRLSHSHHHSFDLFSNIHSSDCIKSNKPLSFEKLDHYFGLVAYQTTISTCGNLTIPSFADFVYVYVNRKYMGTLVRKFYENTTKTVQIDNCDSDNNQLFLLVENQARITYETLNDYKGILSDVFLDGNILLGWDQCGIKLPLNEHKLSMKHQRKLKKNLKLNMVDNQKQGIFMGILDVDIPTDTWLDTTGWGKGIVVINGHNIGRYWPKVGPQMTLYIPAEFLKPGTNLVMIIELEGAGSSCPDNTSCVANFIDHPIFNFND